MLRARRLWPFAFGLAIVAAGCGAGSPAPVRFSQADQGRVVSVAAGRRAVVRLDQPVWAFQPIVGSAVRALGPERVAFYVKDCPSLTGCGSVSLVVRAVVRGRAVIVARRGSCGELFRCPPAQRTFTLTVVVR